MVSVCTGLLGEEGCVSASVDTFTFLSLHMSVNLVVSANLRKMPCLGIFLYHLT